jgi:hypothetical protein
MASMFCFAIWNIFLIWGIASPIERFDEVMEAGILGCCAAADVLM